MFSTKKGGKKPWLLSTYPKYHEPLSNLAMENGPELSRCIFPASDVRLPEGFLNRCQVTRMSGWRVPDIKGDRINGL